MRHPEPTLFNMDWQGVVLLRILLLIHLWEDHSQAIANPLMMMEYPRIRPSQMDPPEGGVGAEEAKVAGAVVTLGGGKKKDEFSSKIQIPEIGGKKGHAHDVASAFRQ